MKTRIERKILQCHRSYICITSLVEKMTSDDYSLRDIGCSVTCINSSLSLVKTNEISHLNGIFHRNEPRMKYQRILIVFSNKKLQSKAR
jgi:hypothetical protein